MPIRPADFERYAEEVRRTYAEAERVLTEKIAKRVAAGIEDPGWMEQKLADIRRVREEAERELKVLQKVIEQAAQGIEESFEAGAQAAEEDLQALAREIEGLVEEGRQPVAIQGFHATSRMAVETLVAAAVEALEAVHLRIVRAVEDEYREVIFNAARLAQAGVMTRREAAARALQEFADRGIRGFVDKAGRRWDMASYAEMAVRTYMGQAAVQGHVFAIAERGHDLVIVSDSPEECPLCRPWEGAVLSLSGRTTGRVKMGDGSWREVKGTLSQAIAAGLFHPNCTHDIGLFVEGFTRPMKGTDNPKGYEERQRQRYIERQIRKWKRREAAAITDEERRRARAKVKEWQATMRQFIAETGRRRDYARESINRAR